MKAVLKWLLLGTGVLLVLGIAVVIAVITLVDPDRFRPAIVAAVQEATGRTLTLDGSVDLKLLPCCAVEVQQAALGNPPGFDAGPFVSVGSARLAIRLWPLLTRREVEVGAVRIEGLEANLVGRKDGRNNWTFTDPAAGASPATGGPGTDGVATFNLAGISLKDARVNYRDEADDSHYKVEQLQLDTGPIRNDAPFDVTTSFRLTDLADNSGGTFGLKAQAGVATDGNVTTLRLATVEGDLDATGLGGLQGLRGSLRSPELQVQLADDTRVQAAELTADLQATGTDLPGGTVPVQATLSGLRYDVDAGTGSLARFTATPTVAGITLELAGEGGFGAASDLRGTVRVPEFSPRAVLKTLKADVPVTADPQVLGKLSGSAHWFLRDKSFGLEQLALLLDETKIAGSVTRDLLAEGSKATPRTQFDLTLDRLDADRYLEPDPPAPARGDRARDAKEPPTAIPAEAIRALNLRGRARIGQLAINGLRLASVDVSTAADGGRLRLEPFVAKAYGGALRGWFRLDATGAKSRLTMEQAMSGVDFGALLTDLADVKNITGTMNLDLKGTATGTTDDELLASLAGNLAFSLADGTYQGMDIWYEIRRAQALLRTKAPPARTGPEQTPIKSLDLAGKLADGELRTDRFSAEIPFLRLSGAATVNLPKATLDSKLSALVFEKPVFGDDTSLASLEGVKIPLTIRGPVSGPKVGVDLGKLARETATDTVRKAVEEKLLDRLFRKKQ